MKFLFCCEFYYPSVGGVQEVMKQIAERLVTFGHEVTIATTYLPNRDFSALNGVQVAQFSVKGNLVRGMHGEIERYRQFVRNFECDALLIKAAQQWTFDALWSDLEFIRARKIFIPCGFSGLHEEKYRAYFKYLPDVLRQFNALIFYADDYRDINFARENNIPNCKILSNGASEVEFQAPVDNKFREKFDIDQNEFLILIVGSLTGAKGHLELARAISIMPENGKKIALILNGNDPFPRDDVENSNSLSGVINLPALKAKLTGAKAEVGYLAGNFLHPLKVARRIKKYFFGAPENLVQKNTTPYEQVLECVSEINSSSSNKKAFLVDLSREDLIQAYFAANLFVFPSHIEYSPLVLFEAAASGTPFLTSNAGNAKEIIDWLGGGFSMDDKSNNEGYRIICPQMLADEIAVLINQTSLLEATGKKLQENWQSRFTWDVIARQYEKILISK